jgi:hypothetical protein
MALTGSLGGGTKTAHAIPMLLPAWLCVPGPAGGVLAAMLLRVFTAACRPLLGALHKWLYRGVLDDPASEFFIQASGAP